MKITKQQLYEIIIEETIKEVQQQNKPEPLNDGLIPKALKLPKAAMAFIEKSGDLYWALRDLKFSPSFRPTGWRTTPPIGKVGNKIKEIIDDFESNFLRSFEKALEWKLWRNTAGNVASDAFKTAAGDLANVAELTADLQKALTTKIESFKGLPKTTANVADFTRLKADYTIVSDFKKKLKSFDVFTSGNWKEADMMNALHYLSKGKEPGFWKQIWNSDRAFKTVAAQRKPEAAAAAGSTTGAKSPIEAAVVAMGAQNKMLANAVSKLLTAQVGKGWASFSLKKALYGGAVFGLFKLADDWADKWAKENSSEAIPYRYWMGLFLAFKYGGQYFAGPVNLLLSLTAGWVEYGQYQKREERRLRSDKERKMKIKTQGGEFKKELENLAVLKFIVDRGSRSTGFNKRHETYKDEYKKLKKEFGDDYYKIYNEKKIDGDPDSGIWKKKIDSLLNNVFVDLKEKGAKERLTEDQFISLFLDGWTRNFLTQYNALRQKKRPGAPVWKFIISDRVPFHPWSTKWEAVCKEFEIRESRAVLDKWELTTKLTGLPKMSTGPQITGGIAEFCNGKSIYKAKKMYAIMKNLLIKEEEKVVPAMRDAAKDMADEVRDLLSVGQKK